MSRKTNAVQKIKVDPRVAQRMYEDVLRVADNDPDRVKSNNLVERFGNEDATGVWTPDIKAVLDTQTLKSLVCNEDWVYICCDKIASRIAAQPLMVMKISYKNGKKVTENVDNHPVNKMLENPNEYQTYYHWMYSQVMDLVSIGNSVTWCAFVSKQLIHIPIETIYIDVDRAAHSIRAYHVLANAAEDYPKLKSSLVIPPQQICHSRRPNPSSMMWGLSPFIPGKKSVLFNRYSSEYLNGFYLKGAQPGLALEISKEANEKNALRLLKSLEMAHTGRKNQRRNLILPKGVSVKDISHKLADQQLKEYWLLNRETIINLLQIPKHEFSIQEAGSLGSEEYKTALRNFWHGSLRSTMGLISQSLTKTLRPLLGEDMCLEFDLSNVDVLKDDQMAKALLAQTMLATHTVDEIRQELYDLGPKPVAVQPIAPTTPAELPVEEPIEQESKAIDTRQMNIEKLDIILKSNDGWWKRREELVQAGVDKSMETLSGVVSDIFSDQVISLVKVIKGEVKKSLKNKETLISKTDLRRRLRSASLNFEERYIDEVTKTLSAQVELGYDSSLVLPFNLPNQSEIEAIRARNADGRRETLKARGLETFSNMSKTTTESIMTIIENGLADGKTIDQMVAEVSEKMTGDVSVSRIDTIVRTETLTATSIGQAAAMEDVATVVPNLKKAWVNAGDDRVRGLGAKDGADHWGMQGQVKAYDQPFVDPRSGARLLFPRDPSGGPGDVINCRCTFIMIPGDEADRAGLSDLSSQVDV
jgi:HK97 family phage portal protein